MFESYLVIEEAMYAVTVELRIVAVFYFVVFCIMAPESLVGVPALGNSFHIEGAESVFLRNGGIQLS
jgi:hypothetical protein